MPDMVLNDIAQWLPDREVRTVVLKFCFSKQRKREKANIRIQ
jgi:hypothetical protein